MGWFLSWFTLNYISHNIEWCDKYKRVRFKYKKKYLHLGNSAWYSSWPAGLFWFKLIFLGWLELAFLSEATFTDEGRFIVSLFEDTAFCELSAKYFSFFVLEFVSVLMAFVSGCSMVSVRLPFPGLTSFDTSRWSTANLGWSVDKSTFI